jgi:hypothetical protein
MATPTPLNSATYDGMNNAILEIIKAGNYATISIYTDAAGTIYETDGHGNMDKRFVLSTSYTASYKNKDGIDTNPFVVIQFKDTAGNPSGEFIDYFTTVDNVDDHWYVLGSEPVPAFQF